MIQLLFLEWGQHELNHFFERENVTQIVVYTKRKTIFATAEPDLSIKKKLQVVNSIKRITSQI